MRYLLVTSALFVSVVILSFQNCGRLTGGPLPQSTSSGSGQLSSQLGADVLPPRVPLVLDCTRVSQAYSTVHPEAKISWHANKGTEVAPLPVDGTFGFDAILYKEPNATNHQLKIRFDMGSLSSGVVLRNQRIRDIVFGSASGYRIEYDATLTAQQMQSAQALLPGNSLQLLLSGNLTIWGVAKAFEVPVIVTRTMTGFQISSVAGFSMGIISQMGLQSQLEELSVLCKAMALDKVGIEFNFSLVQICSN